MVKEETVESESEELERKNTEPTDQETQFNNLQDCCNGGLISFADLKDGSSDSDSSAILNEDNSPNAAAAISCSGAFLMMPNGCGSPSSLSANRFNQNPVVRDEVCRKAYQPPPAQLVKIEEYNFFGGGGGEEACSSLFSDEQAPILHWYSPEDWN